MSSTSPHDPCAIVSQLLQNTANPEKLSALCTPNCTFVSITYSNPPLKAVLPFAGRHTGEGPKAILDTFATVDRIWKRSEFSVDTIFSGPNNISLGADVFGHSGFAETQPSEAQRAGRVVDVGVFGSFSLESRTTGKKVRSPYCVWCKVDTGIGGKGGKVVYMQYLEDTMGATSVLKRDEGYGRFEVFEGEGGFEVGPDGKV